jgi:hypothetical protein
MEVKPSTVSINGGSIGLSSALSRLWNRRGVLLATVSTVETNKNYLVRLILVPLIVNLMLASAWAQQSPIAAITQDGRKVLLYPDGTWKLAEQAQPQASPAMGNNPSGGNSPGTGNHNGPGNSPVVGRNSGNGNNPGPGNINQNSKTENNTPSGNSKTFVKAPQGDFGVWIDEQKWTQSESGNDATKITFIHQGETSYAMIIGERVRISMEALERAALQNAKKVVPDITLLFKEKRVISGRSVLCMQMTGTVQGSSFMYYGYYYGGPEGTLQVICYTTPELFDQAKADFDELLGSVKIGQ